MFLGSCPIIVDTIKLELTNPLNQSTPNVVELNKGYTTCHADYIIMQDENEKQDKQFADIEKEKNNLTERLDKTHEDWNTCKKKLHGFI